MKAVHVGCSGWVYKEWRGEFYPEKLPQREWLRHYSETFGTVEVNNTFYRLPTKDAVKGWVAETPQDFRFAVKGSRYTTHIKRLKDFRKYSSRFFSAVEPMIEANKLAVVLWQLPPNFGQDLDRLEKALEALRERPGRHAFEFRHESWFSKPTYDLLTEHDAALVLAHDARDDARDSPRKITAGWTYVRFHYGERGRRGNYSDAELGTWRRRIAVWRRNTEVYAYFNNDWEAFAPRDAETLASSF